MTAPEGRTLLLGIGAQKAGTSWIHKYLTAHPQVWMSPIKELHYFDAKFKPELCGYFQAQFLHRLSQLCTMASENFPNVPLQLRRRIERMTYRVNMDSDERYYLAYLQSELSDEVVFGEITPSYSILDSEHFQHMHRLHPKTKFLFIMRDPVDRYWSALRMMKRDRGKKGLPSFNLSVEFARRIRQPEHYQRGDYEKTITALESAVPLSDIHYEFYENLFTDSAIDRICRFLQIDSLPADFSTEINSSPGTPMSDALFSIGRDAFAPIYRFCERRFADSLPEYWRSSRRGR